MAAPMTLDGRANDISALDEHRVLLKGDASLRRGSLSIRSDQLEYDKDTDEAQAEGQVIIKRDDLIVRGPRARLKLEANEGSMERPMYRFVRTNGSGSASKIDFLGKGQYRADEATYSTCNPGNMSWFLRAERLDINEDEKVAVARGGRMYFQGVPVLASPYLSIPLSDERRSGVLPPTVGSSSSGGMDISIPYYFNIAPNRDLTLQPRLLSKRGVQLGATFRYLEPSYSGQLQGEYLPKDAMEHENRWFYRFQHRQNILPGLSFYVDRAAVSDDKYPSDMGRNVSAVVQQQFNQEVGLNYGQGNWAALARVQNFQTLAPNVPPFNRAPQVNVLYNNRQAGDFVISAEADVTKFAHPTNFQRNGLRTFVKPEISYLYQRPGYFLIPKVSFHASSYTLNQPTVVSGQTQITRLLPTVSLDSGLIFERAATEWSSLLGKSMRQTLEPRLFYVYTPFREQSQIPIFDTASADFNLTQIFSEQPFVGADRVADNNKLTAGVTSRLIESDSGAERARFILAQRFDLQGQRVTIGDTSSTATRKYSDVLAGASVRLFPQVNLESAVQYNLQQNQLQRSSIDVAWRPGVQRTLNFGYRYQRPNDVLGVLPLRQFVISGQWPLWGNIYGIGRANYDRAGHKMVDSLVGFEYDADCWIGRVVLQRFTNPSATVTTNFFFQIEFKGLSKLGNNDAGNIFKLNIPGYTPLSSRPIGAPLHDNPSVD